MVENSRLSVLMGGLYHCTPEWNRDRETDRSHFLQCFAFWLPVSGGASIETTSGNYEITPGNVYFIPAPHLLRQTCEHQMTVAWAAFTSESYHMHHRLVRIRGVHRWPLASIPWVEVVFRRFVEYFEEEPKSGRVRKNPPAGLGARIEGTLMCLAGDLIESTEGDFQQDDSSGLERIKPAIDFMDEEYLRTHSLPEIAQRIRLAPYSFHRLFQGRDRLDALQVYGEPAARSCAKAAL